MLPKNKPDSQDLLAWYDRHRRVLPWRAMPHQKPDPYHVWLSEIMLQQTTVAAVVPYFQNFLQRWPTVKALAKASLEEILAAWAGLGYYARARNLHACAKYISKEKNGMFPQTDEELQLLPGVGPYTAAAITAIAFGQKATVIDGNVERVITRLFALNTPLPLAKKEIRLFAEKLSPFERYGDYAQAVMDLGATICTPKSPKCILCPWQKNCAAFALGQAEEFPKRVSKKENPSRRGLAFWLTDQEGYIWLRQRPLKGLLGGMLEVPSTEWTTDSPTPERLLKQAPLPLPWKLLPGVVRHTFTHFPLELHVATAKLPLKKKRPSGQWIASQNLKQYALPSVMIKVARHALESTPTE